MSLSSIERAKLIAELLDLRKGLTDLSALAKAKSISRILGIRKQLFGKGSAFQDVLQRLKDNPLPEYSGDEDASVSAKYEKALKQILPSAEVHLRTIAPSSVIGTVKAMYSVLKTYPALANNLDFVGSHIDLVDASKALIKKRNKMERQVFVRLIKDDKERYAEFMSDMKGKFEEGISQFKKIVPSEYHSYTKNKEVSAKLLKHLDIPDSEKAKRLIRKQYKGIAFDPNHPFSKDFLDKLKKIYLEERMFIRGRSKYIWRQVPKNKDLEALENNVLVKHSDSLKLEKRFKRATGVCCPTDVNKDGGCRSGIYANAAMVYGGETFSSLAAASIKSEWHPQGTFDANDPASAAAQTITHELGHSLDNLLGVRNDPRILELYKQNDGDRGGLFVFGSTSAPMKKLLSSYADADVMEMIAEAFCEYRLNKNPRPLAMRIGKIIDEYYAKKFG